MSAPDDRRPTAAPSVSADALTEIQHVVRRVEFLARGIRLRAAGDVAILGRLARERRVRPRTASPTTSSSRAA